MTASVDLRDVASHFDKVKDKMREAALRGLLGAAVRMQQEIVARIVPARAPQPVDRGVYRAGWRTMAIEGGAAIENLEAHAAFVEHGVRGSNVRVGGAMIVALAEWGVRKGYISPDDARDFAWGLAANMRRRGIFAGGTGLGILEEATKLAPKLAREEVARELRKL